MVKKWLSFRGAGPKLVEIDKKDKETGRIPKKITELKKTEDENVNILNVTYLMKGIWKQDKEKIGDTFFQMEIPDGGQRLDKPGSPQIPQEGLFIAIPDNTTILEVKVIDTESKTYKIDKHIIPVPKPTRDAPPSYKKDQIYKKDEYYPGSLFKNLGTEKIGDVNVLHLMVYPVQYNPVLNSINVYSKILFGIHYKTIEPKFRGGLGIPKRSPRKRRIPKMYKDNILNLDNID